MFFLVYFDPTVIDRAAREGECGMALLVAILRGMQQNCFFADFANEDVTQEMADRVRALPEEYTRKGIKSALARLVKENRCVPCLEYDTDPSAAYVDLARSQGQAVGLAVAVVEPTSEGDDEKPFEVTDLVGYQYTGFESERSALSSRGATVVPDELDGPTFFNRHFAVAVRHASHIEICDGVFGRKFVSGGDFGFTIGEFIRWIGKVKADRDGCTLVIHCEDPDNVNRRHDIEHHLKDVRDKHCGGLMISVQYYKNKADPSRCLPHARFLVTDRMALNIDRGMDFLVLNTRKTRDVHLAYMSLAKATEVLARYSSFRNGTPIQI
jgi:hypothetical protein